VLSNVCRIVSIENRFFGVLLRVADPELCAGSRVFAATPVLVWQNQNIPNLFDKDFRKCSGPGSYPKRNGIRYTPYCRILDYTSHVLYFTSTCEKSKLRRKKTLQFVIINNYNKDLLKRFLSALRHCDAVIDHHSTVLGDLNKEIGTKIMFQKSGPSFLSSPIPVFLSSPFVKVADPHHFNADPDQTFHCIPVP